MSIRDEQITNTTIPSPTEDEVGFPRGTPMTESSSTDAANGYEESGGSVPHWEEDPGADDRSRYTVRAALFGGLAGGVFFIGLAAALLSGHFWPVFLVALAISSLVGSLSSSKAQAIYGGFQGCVFFLGLAVLAATSWWWPGILVLLGIEAILGIGNGLLALWPVARPSMTVDHYYTAIRNHNYALAYRFLDASLTRLLPQEHFTQMANVQDAAEGSVSKYTIAPDLAITTTPLPGEPLPLVNFERNPAENVIVTVRRTHAPSYMVHLQVRHVGDAWKITAFDRI